MLHDLQIPGSKANLDHVVITSAGVFYIDSKHYPDKKIHFTLEGSDALNVAKFLMGKGIGVKHLTIDGKNADTTIEPFYWELEQLKASLPKDVPLYGVLCFVNGLWENIKPLGGSSWGTSGWFFLNHILVCSPNLLGKRLSKFDKSGINVTEVRDLVQSIFPTTN